MAASVVALALAVGSASAPGASLSGPIPPNAISLEIYHVNQANYSGIENMNTADAAGDAFFDLRALSTYYMCHINKTGHGGAYPGQCDNPEEISDNLVVTKVQVLANPDFAKYGECNVCMNSTVPMSHPPQKCVDGSYHCRCDGPLPWGPDAPCKPNMGMVKVDELIGGFSKWMNFNSTGPGLHWMVNLADRVGGTWYSTVTAGNCDSQDSTSCGWKLNQTIKEINATCLATYVQNKVQEMGSSCFSQCPGGTSDVHTSCYIHCYYATLLGPEAATAHPATGGLTGEQITQVWTDGFDSCPPL